MKPNKTKCPKCGIELKWWSDERVHEYCNKCGYEKMPTASRLGLISSPCKQATENTKTGKKIRRIIEAELVHAVFPSTPTLGVIQHKEKHIDRMVYILTRSAEHLIEAIRWKKSLSHPLDSITPEFDKGTMFGYNQSISLISDLFDLEGERTVTTTDDTDLGYNKNYKREDESCPVCGSENHKWCGVNPAKPA